MKNPKNMDDWTIYPHAPKPTYKYRNRYNQIAHGGNDEEEFDFSQCIIPEGSDKFYYKQDEKGLFQIRVIIMRNLYRFLLCTIISLIWIR